MNYIFYKIRISIAISTIMFEHGDATHMNHQYLSELKLSP